MNKHTRTYQLLTLFVFILSALPGNAQNNNTASVDICIYGGTSAGVVAAYTAKKLGKTVILVEPGSRLGGLTTGGLGQTDIGNKYAVSGVSLDFYRRIGKHYGKLEQWTFEPHVAKEIFDDYLRSAGVQVLYQYRLASVKKTGASIKEIIIESSTGHASNKIIAAKMFIDCTYEGDLVAKSGVSYTVGREANSLYNETYNGVQLRDKHQFPDGIDPYKTPGNKESGLLWGITNGTLDPMGSGDKKVQTYNIRVCLTNNAANRVAINKPDDYKPERYELLLRFLEKKPSKSLLAFMTLSKMPGSKTDINNNGPFSTDMIGTNWSYPDAGYKERSAIQKAHDDYTKGFFYFIGHDPRMPAYLSNEMLQWGYPRDEYTDNNNWTPQMYVRESRRMIGEYVMTQANCEGKEKVADGIALAAYTMDSHNCQRIVVDGMVKNEGDVEIGGFDPYPISYRSVVPKIKECTNLLVPVCLSASHIAYGSIRMEPVFMVLAQSAAVAATLAIDNKQPVQDVNVNRLKKILKTNPRADNSEPDIWVDNDDSANVIVNGSWSLEKRGGYGTNFLLDSSKSQELKSVKFIPPVNTAGNYQVYTYFQKPDNGAAQTQIKVFDGNQGKDVIVKRSDIQVLGQTSGEWISLGKYKFPKGKKAYIEISNKGADGAIIADAILLVKEK
jgi:hypothetical protein